MRRWTSTKTWRTTTRKAFWTAHKDVYDEQVKAPLVALAAALGPEFGEAKLFRPYRDIRFAKDKTPYKTHEGVWFGEQPALPAGLGGRSVPRWWLLAYELWTGGPLAAGGVR